MQLLCLRSVIVLLTIISTSSCTYNPLTYHNDLTAKPEGAIIGAGIGAGSVALLGGSRPLMWLGGISGSLIGYYVTTLRYSASGVYHGHGKYYNVGQFATINLNTDQLFEPNTDEFLLGAESILDSALNVLKAFPQNNILLSGNTSGFDREQRELKLSTARVKKIAQFLEAAGLNNATPNGHIRSLRYVGYGNYFPIANHNYNRSIRQNSRIQITSYPRDYDLRIKPQEAVFNNMGSLEDNLQSHYSATTCAHGCKFKDD